MDFCATCDFERSNRFHSRGQCTRHPACAYSDGFTEAGNAFSYAQGNTIFDAKSGQAGKHFDTTANSNERGN